ncbi:MAG: hypothetical protein PSX71_08620 [bacterium]|nr:hypothetical protein [bacterium]
MLIKVRALVDTFSDNSFRKAGEVFEIEEEKMGDGLELTTKKNNAVARAAALRVADEAAQKAESLRAAADAAAAASDAAPGNSDLAAAALTAEDVAKQAEVEAEDLANVAAPE